MGPPILAYNAWSLWPAGSGVQTYIRELLGSLAKSANGELVARVGEDAVDELPEGVTALASPRRTGIRNLLDQARMPIPADLIHGLDVHIPVGRRTNQSPPVVSTVHDMAVFDVPWAFNRRWVLRERAGLSHAARRADVVITVSEFTADRFQSRFRRPAVPIPLAARSGLGPPDETQIKALRDAHEIPDRFVVCVSTIEPRKDIDSLAQACELAKVPLVLAGKARGIVPASAIHLGYIQQHHLAALYATATVVAYPSVYEGFGLPPLEAMACGAAVVGYAIPPLVEVTQGAALLTKAYDVKSLASSIRRLFNDEAERQSLVEAGIRRAAQLTWEETGEKTLATYRDLGVRC